MVTLYLSGNMLVSLCMTKKVAANDRFKNLTVIRYSDRVHIEPSGKKRKVVIVKCDCGEEFEMQTLFLHRKDQNCPRCSYLNYSIVKIGDIYDKLTVIGFDKSSGRRQAVCQCTCGNTVHRRAELLQRINLTNNCGCKPRGNYKGVEDISQTYFGRIKKGAERRKLKFDDDITTEFLWQLYLKQNKKCVLTGLEIIPTKSDKIRGTASLDRIDSSKGYTRDNLQWIHKDINLMKMDFDQSQFIEYCKLIASNFIKS